LDSIDECLRQYQVARNRYVKELKDAKNKCWRTFISTVGNENPWGILHKIAKNKVQQTPSVGVLLLPTGERTTSWLETMTILFQKFAPTDNRDVETQLHQNIRLNNKKYVNMNLEPDITIEEVDAVLKKTKNKKSPGLDQLNPEIVKNFWSCCKEPMFIMYNKCLREGRFPTKWKIANVKIIPKNFDVDPELITSYRPIALLPVFSKVLERIIVDRF